MKHLLFAQLDSWFFRESRSMDGSGATILSSKFPPANATLLGAVRTMVGDAYHVKNGTTWTDFKSNSELQRIIGYSDNYADITAQGSWLYNVEQKQTYFPAPLNLIKTNNSKYDFFAIGEAEKTDIGHVRLPQLDYGKGHAPLEEPVYISQTEYSHMLAGNRPESTIQKSEIICKDPRLGIARDKQTRKAEDSKLYQTEHIRLCRDWQLYMGVAGIKDTDFDFNEAKPAFRLGGEARMSALTIMPSETTSILPNKPEIKNASGESYIVIYLLTPLPDSRESNQSMVMPNNSFTLKNDDEHDFWQGTIKIQNNTMDLNIVTAFTGKLERVGGWDMVKHESKPMRSFIPAGSCWYMDASKLKNPQQIIDTLHGSYLTQGADKAQGYGQIAIGIVKK